MLSTEAENLANYTVLSKFGSCTRLLQIKTSWILVVFTNIVGNNSRYFVGVFNKTAIPLALVDVRWLSPTRSYAPLYHLISNAHSWKNCYYNIARVLALYKSYWAAMNKIFIYARPCVNKMTWAFFLSGCKVQLSSFKLQCSAVFLLFKIWTKPAKNCPIFVSALTF